MGDVMASKRRDGFMLCWCDGGVGCLFCPWHHLYEPSDDELEPIECPVRYLGSEVL